MPAGLVTFAGRSLRSTTRSDEPVSRITVKSASGEHEYVVLGSVVETSY